MSYTVSDILGEQSTNLLMIKSANREATGIDDSADVLARADKVIK